MRRFSVTLLLFALLFSSFSLVLPVNTSANPIYITSILYDSGGLFLGENVSMPEAEVSMVLDPIVAKSFNLSSFFTLTSEVNHTVQTAFAYPQEWDFSGSKTSRCEFDVRFNQEEINFVILTFTQILDMYNESIIDSNNWTVEDWIWIEDHHFAAFNLSFIENTSNTLEVYGSSPIEIPTGGYNASYNFRYCVGSASSWGEVTHETIRIDVRASVSQNTVLDNGKLYWDYINFFPETGFTETQNQTWTSAIWELEMFPNDQNITHVGFNSHYYASWTWNPPVPTTNEGLFEFVVFGLPMAGVTIIVVAVFVRRRNFAK